MTGKRKLRGFLKKSGSIAVALMLFLSLAACNTHGNLPKPDDVDMGSEVVSETVSEPVSDSEALSESLSELIPEEKDTANGDIYILYTSDVHCGIDEGFGYAGLWEIRNNLEEKGYATILVDDGDAFQGESIGMISKGESIVKLMNAVGYDVAIPGNHDFDYGVDRLLELVKEADYPYICCNFNKEGELVFAPYLIKEVGDLKIAFVGVTTPDTITSSTPEFFQNEKGEFIYDFMRGGDGQELYDAVQKAVDDARAEGADLVYGMGHLGLDEACSPWMYSDVISNTNGIDVFLDGHSHDTEQIVVKNKDGADVLRSAVGTKLNTIGYSHISADGQILETGIWSWPNEVSAPDLLHIENKVGDIVEEDNAKLAEKLAVPFAKTDYDLTINDPEEKDESGNPVRIVRRKETNLGDFCADAYRDQTGADIAIVNGGGVRANIEKGDITYEDILEVHPFGNYLCVVEVTGRQILDALEWGVRGLPDENGAFLQVSGLSYEADATVENNCQEDENGMFAGVSGKRRVKNVMVGDSPLDPKKTYTLVSNEYMLMECGDGFSMFENSVIKEKKIHQDYTVLIDYITKTLGGEVGEDYADPYGQGRIKISE